MLLFAHMNRNKISALLMFCVVSAGLVGCGEDATTVADAGMNMDARGSTFFDSSVKDAPITPHDATTDSLANKDTAATDAQIVTGDAGSSTDAANDSGSGDAAPASCAIGTAQNSATSGTLNLFGEVVYFNDGAALPTGTYEAAYLGGCMKYASSQGWAVHAYPEPSLGWYVVGETNATRLAHLPGAVGYDKYPVFDDCVAAGLLVPPVQFQHAGGKIGVWLYDSAYSDNVAGPNGMNPKWKLTQLGVNCDK